MPYVFCYPSAMFRSLTRPFLILFLMLALVLPQVSAAIALTGITDMRVMVICTGDGLQRITVDETGAPTQLAELDERCVLLHAADTSCAAHCPDAISVEFVFDTHAVVDDVFVWRNDWFSRSHPRAPPVV